MKSDIDSPSRLLVKQKKDGSQVFVVYVISRQAGHYYSSLIDLVEEIKVVNPTKTTWVYRTTKICGILSVYLIFSVARLIAANARAISQKRTTTCCSGQPFL
ncbi:hypothetical protein SMSP2_01722 [Limihaloglobus sulfuriphilus]|uniref:Uncharacterized protein n=1 Tax=Limihaloglobus sulfuriphilus TaxID=1851148 RepID=A0A1Q2MFB2_9BACT|nr:hypothetical protein SMSP2_01722 [Limihaloglobus sulfuriphilus]